MKQAISAVTCFNVILNGCQKWKNGTFILRVNQDEYIQQLQKSLSRTVKGVIKTLHLTITRNIPERLLNQLSLDDFHYMGNFTCESVLLLKRNGSNPYQLLEKIDLSKS
jgi:hypothetical protein